MESLCDIFNKSIYSSFHLPALAGPALYPPWIYVSLHGFHLFLFFLNLLRKFPVFLYRLTLIHCAEKIYLKSEGPLEYPCYSNLHLLFFLLFSFLYHSPWSLFEKILHLKMKFLSIFYPYLSILGLSAVSFFLHFVLYLNVENIHDSRSLINNP